MSASRRVAVAGASRPGFHCLRWLILSLALLTAGPFAPALAQETGEAVPAPPDRKSVAAVRVDGKVLFQVRGISAYPANRRASEISERIVTFARDDNVPVTVLSFTAHEDYYAIKAGELQLTRLYEFDADLEGVPLPVISEVVVGRIAETVVRYREDRSSEKLRLSALYAVGLTVVLVLLAWAVTRLRRWLERIVKARVDASMADLERRSGSVLHRGHLWTVANGLLQALWILALLVIAYFYLSSVLGSFPWTRGVALLLLEFIRTPVVVMAEAFVHAIPDLMFLLVLWVVVRYLLRTMLGFFEAIASGRLRLNNFDVDWAMPTYRLLRIAVVAFALVVAYPYIPGSDSAAFKGISIFLGVVFSLGSTSFIANLVAGMALTYRGVFREGDWVRIGNAEGRVESIRAQTVRIRTRANERITIPSSTILNADVVNYSDPIAGGGLVLSCEVGIGYDVAWRDVERFLLTAAERTEGVRETPAPWVYVLSLGDFAVSYALRVVIDDPKNLPAIRNRLNREVLDAFHAEGVQIMSPAYVADPESPKVPTPEGQGGT